MPTDAVITLSILVLMLVLLVTEWIPHGVTGLLTIAALAAGGVLTSAEAFSGLMNPAVVTVACMYVISAAVSRTGAAAVVADRIRGSGRTGSPAQAFYGILAITMLLSGFVNNAPLVLIFLPLVLGLANGMGEPPSRLLIPLSFVSILGGMCTLVGTSTNLIVASSLQEVSGGQLQIGMFDFAPLGIILAIVGSAFVLIFRRRLLPVRASLDLQTRRGVAVEYMTEIALHKGSALVGCTLRDVQERDLLGEGLTVLEVVRGEVIRVPRPELSLGVGDLLLVKGNSDAVLQLRLEHEKSGAENGQSDAVRGVALTLFEVVVTPGSAWIGQRVSKLGLRDRFDSSVFAVQRHGTHLREKIGQLRLLAGDVLLLQGTDESLVKLRTSQNALVVEGVDQIARDTRRAPLAILALAAFVALAVTRVVPIEVAALIAALLAVLTRCLSARSAYESIGWDVLFLVAGTLAFGKAFELTGLAQSTAAIVLDAGDSLGPQAVLAALLVFTTVLTQVLSNNATAAVMTPVAYELGQAIDGTGPMPFVMAVAFGANCCFLTPFAYKTNLIIYGPGGYAFRDFLRLGLPLTLLYLLIAAALLPIFY